MLGGWAQVKTALARTVQTTEAEGMEIAVLVHLAALGVIIVGRDKAVAPTEAVALGVGTREAELLLEEALRETTEAQADLTGAETDREAAPTEGAVASQTTALTATARTESKALIVSYKLTHHGRYAPMVENEH